MPGRNVESRFAENPTNLDMSRSRFARNSHHLTSFNVGDLVPFYVDEVLPGDTFDVRTAKVVRMQPMVAPPMDDLYLDTYYFFVPNRLVWTHWRELMGENTASAWVPQTNYTVPQLQAPSSTGWITGSVADYLGIPVGVTNLSVNALPFRAYALIWNEWFRDQNLQSPGYINTGDSTLTGSNAACDAAPNNAALGGLPFKVSKYHDYFTSCLPSPQKAADVRLPLFGENASIPVVAKNDYVSQVPLATSGYPIPLIFGTGTLLSSKKYLFSGTVEGSTVVQPGTIGSSGSPASVASSSTYAPVNLWTSGEPSYLGTINQLRMAFQLQKAFEKDARGGTRYIEILKTHFGVTSPDARLQRPEYLGGNRLAINVNQVLQQSATVSGQTPQGNPAAISLTHDNHEDFVRSFTEHGFVIGVMAARYPHTYQQGLERFWRRKTRFDFYWPVLANIGEQGVLNSEIYAQGTGAVNPTTGEKYDDEIFGYQEAWADYRYKPNRVSGEMRSAYTTPLDMWHFADEYASLPMLSASWIKEDKSNVDRVLAVSSSVSNQLWADIAVINNCTRCMPLYSIPGLLDHH